MPTNAEISASILKLDPKAELTDSMTNQQLAEKLAELRAAKARAEDDTLADLEKAKERDAKKAEKLAKTAKKKPAFPYSMAKGKSLTTKRGILADGQEITAKDLAGGQTALDEWVELGYVVKA